MRQTPDGDYLITTEYDAADRPVRQWVPRAANVDDPQVLFGGHSDAQHAQCPTAAGQPLVLEVPADKLPGYKASTSVCVTEAAYDAVDNATKLILPSADPATTRRFVEWSYTDDGLVSTMRTPSPADDPAIAGDERVGTSYGYDAAGRPTLARESDGDEHHTTYTLDGLVKTVEQFRPAASSSDPARVTNYGYDLNGNLTSVTDAEAQVWKTEYTSDNLVEAVHTPSLGSSSGNVTRYRYDANGNPTRVYSPVAVARASSNAAGRPTVNEYTLDNLLDWTAVPTGSSGDTRRLTDYGYDLAGRKTSQRVAVERLAGGDWVTETNAGTSRFDYDRADRLVRETGRSTASGPNIIDPNAPTITTGYDAAGNPVSITDSTNPAADISIEYYLDDLQRLIDDGRKVTRYTYNGAGQKVLRSTAAQGAAESTAELTRYTYNAAGRVASQTVRGSDTEKYERTYAVDGRLLEETLPNGQEAQSDYNDDDTLASYQLRRPDGSAVATWNYEYDKLFRVTKVTVPDAANAAGAAPDAPTTEGVHGYDYDEAGRLVCQTTQAVADATTGDCSAQGGVRKAGVWDANNNRREWGAQKFTYNADDSIATATDKSGSNTKTYSYAPFGGLESDGCSTYAYDPFDRLRRVESAAAATATEPPAGCPDGMATATYDYDGLDRQRATTISPRLLAGAPLIDDKVTRNDYDGTSGAVTDEADTAGPATAVKEPRRYTLDEAGAAKAVGTGTATTQNMEYLTTDGKGNITTVTGDGGEVKCAARYDPFGEPQNETRSSPAQGCTTGQTNSTLFYRGGRRDQNSGNYQLGSRTYDPSKAGFLTPDSSRADAPTADLSVGVDPLTMNRYSYVNGDPVNLVDPDGHSPCAYGDAPASRCESMRSTRAESGRPLKPAGPGGVGSPDGGGYRAGVSQQDPCCTDSSSGGSPNAGSTAAFKYDRQTMAESWAMIQPTVNGYAAQGTELLQPEDTRDFYLTLLAAAGVAGVGFVGAGALAGGTVVPAGAGATGAAAGVAATKFGPVSVNLLKGVKARAPNTTLRGGAGPVRVGQQGLDALGITQNTTRIRLPSGGYRVPDVLDEAGGVIGEVKNVQSLSYTSQLRDYASYAQANQLQFDLYVRGSTRLSGPLQQAVSAGDINLFRALPP